MTRKQVFRLFHTRFGLVLFSLIALSACSSASPLHQADEIAIYSAVIRRIYTQDDTFGGTFQAPTVYVLQDTDDSVGDPGLEPSEPRALTAVVQSGIDTSLAGMPMQIVWIDDSFQMPVSASFITAKGRGCCRNSSRDGCGEAFAM